MFHQGCAKQLTSIDEQHNFKKKLLLCRKAPEFPEILQKSKNPKFKLSKRVNYKKSQHQLKPTEDSF